MRRTKTFKANDEGKLFLVGTPIGNLKDISERALLALHEVDLIYCEDTKTSIKMLTSFGIKKPLFSLHEHNEISATSTLIDKIKTGQSVAYISDAGNPIVSDPGNILVREAIKNNINIVTILGPSAFLHALISSGFDASNFTFKGFLAREEKKREEELIAIKNYKETVIIYEAPHRFQKLIKSIAAIIPERRLCVARELTKIHEEFLFGTAEELAKVDSETIIGEIVVVIEGSPKAFVLKDADDEQIAKVYKLLKEKMSTKDIIDFIVKLNGLKKNHVYQVIENLKK